MKKIIIALVALMPLMAMADDELVFKGTITGLEEGMRLSLVNMDKDQNTPTQDEYADIEATQDFTIKAKLDGPTELRFSVMKFNADYDRYTPVAFFNFMADNERVELPKVSLDTLISYIHQNRTHDVILKAGKCDAEYREYFKLIQPDIDGIAQVYKEGGTLLMLAAFGMADENNDSIKMFKNQETAFNKSKEQKTRDFIKQHPDYAFSALLVSRELNAEYKYTNEEIDKIVETIKGNPDAHRMAIIEKNAEKARKFALGNEFGDEAVTMADGEVKTLQQLLRKDGFTLFDCWASWCGPCRLAIPKVKNISEQFASVLSVVSISIDQKEADWRKAMEEEAMPWPQAIATKEQAMPLMTAYGISTIPRLILVKNNRIVVSTNSPDEVREALQKAL